MAKAGFDYYNTDTDRYQDKRIKRLKKEHSCAGIAVYDFILSEVYRVKGFYLDWDNDVCFDVSDYFDISEEKVNEILNTCIDLGLFNQQLFDSKKVITSRSIQKRYKEMCKRAKRSMPIIPEELQVSPEELPKVPEEIPVSSEETLQSKVKESKEEESNILETNVSVGETPTKVDLFVEDERKLYRKVNKTTEDIHAFISQHKPVIPEPYFEYWNLFAMKYEYTQVLSLNDKRKAKLRTRLNEPLFNIGKILYHAANSAGIKELREGHWFTFDWIIANSTNYLKVLEGNYKRQAKKEEDNSLTDTDKKMMQRYNQQS